MWTRFMDMHSGGNQKLDWAYIYIEAPEAAAREIFEGKFGRNPYNVTCDCCGEDYSISEDETLEQATKYNRYRYNNTELPLDEYVKDPTILVICKEDL